jgi:hypothetical protein
MSWLDVFVNCCIVAIVALFLFMEGVKASPSPSLENGHAAYFLADHPNAHGDCSKSLPIEREVRGENESENDGEEDETSELTHNITTGITFNSHPGKILFFQLILASESRASISLVILHHCWKCFLH